MTVSALIKEKLAEFRKRAIAYKLQHHGDESLGLDDFAEWAEEALQEVADLAYTKVKKPK